MAGESWASVEAELTRLHGQGLGLPEIARRLGRTPRALRQHLYRDRLDLRRRVPAESFHEAVRRLNARGLDDAQVGKEIGRSKSYVFLLRQQLGLKANRPDRTARGRESQRRVKLRYGMSLPKLSWARDRVAAMAMGWPAGCTRKHAEILESLFRVGPATPAGVAADAGRHIRNTQSVLRKFLKERWVTRRRVFRAQLVYDLEPNVRAVRQAAEERKRGD